VPAFQTRISIVEKSYPLVYNASGHNDLQANLMNRFMNQFENDLQANLMNRFMNQFELVWTIAGMPQP
jgi:hypothetical protein